MRFLHQNGSSMRMHLEKDFRDAEAVLRNILDGFTEACVVELEQTEEEIKKRKITKISVKTFRKLIELLVHILWQIQRISPIPAPSSEHPFLLKRNWLKKRAPRSSPHRLPKRD